MKKPEYNSATITLTTGDTVKEVDFPHIDGVIKTYSTHLVGERFGKRVRLVLKDGGTDIHRPIDIAFSETEGRCSFEGGQVPLNISNPGRITASVQLDSALGANETIKVEVLLISEKGQNASDNLNC